METLSKFKWWQWVFLLLALGAVATIVATIVTGKDVVGERNQKLYDELNKGS